jgi:enoyl-CoA hydratase/carnithine racemase
MSVNVDLDDRPGPNCTEGPVLAEMHGSVLVLTLNRPDKLNAWGQAMEARYFELLDQAQESPNVRAIVVTGTGRGFCVGADFDDLKSVADSDTTPLQRSRPISYPMTISKPLVAAINGPAAGVGLIQALYCDVRITAPNVKLTTAFAEADAEMLESFSRPDVREGVASYLERRQPAFAPPARAPLTRH